MQLTTRFDAALHFAHQLHRRQVRKGTQTPYFAHLLSVTALVLEHGGDEDSAIAALLHDAAEDQGGLATLEQIRQRFGARVADIVAGCSDSLEHPKPPWRQRKEAYLAHLPQASPEVRLVSLADKVHNARSILSDLCITGETIWTHFNGGKEGTLWYYRQLVDIFQRLPETALTREFAALVDEIERVSAS